MTKPVVDYQSFRLMFAAQSQCARCEKQSPIVFFNRSKAGGQKEYRNYMVRKQIAERLADEGWELNTRLDKAFCPQCKRIGKPP